VAIARHYYHELHTPIPDSLERNIAKKELMNEVEESYGALLGPAAVPPNGDFTLEEVLRLKKKMPSTAPRPDGIPYPFWKEMAQRIDSWNTAHPDKTLPTFWETFTKLTNWLALHGTNSHGFKNANISLFFKKGDPTLVSNYRPISSMNTDCKMYTNLINMHLSPWAECKLHLDQKGFVPNHLITEHTRLASEVLHLANSVKQNGYLISLDQSKAYDRVDQPLLLTTMTKMGLPPQLLTLISDILHQPKSRVRINSSYSKWFTL
jgi:Reverse transcriptase (RNA-dependent DNA polymerase)